MSHLQPRAREQILDIRLWAACLAGCIAGYPVLVVLGIEYLVVMLVCAAGLLYLVWAAASVKRQLTLPTLVWLGVAVLLAGIVYSHAGHRQSLFYIMRDVVIYVGPVGLLLIVRGLRRSETRVLAGSAAFLLLVNGIAALGLFIWGRPVSGATVLQIGALSQRVSHSFSAPDVLLGQVVARPSAFFSFSTSLGVAALVFAALGFRRLGPSAFGLVAIFGALTISRTVFVVGLAGVLLLVLSRPLGRSARMIVAAGYSAVLAVVLATLSGDASVGDSVVGRGANSNSTRLAIYEASLNYWDHFNSRYPLGGLGNPVILESVPYPLGSHSMYLGMLFRFGLLGLAGFVLMMGPLLWQAAKASPSAVAWVSSVIIIFVVEDVTLDPLNWVGLIIVVGIGLRSVDDVAVDEPSGGVQHVAAS